MGQTILSKNSSSLQTNDNTKVLGVKVDPSVNNVLETTNYGLAVKVNPSEDNLIQTTNDGIYVKNGKGGGINASSSDIANDIALSEDGSKTAKGQGLLLDSTNPTDLDFNNHTEPEIFYIPATSSVLNGPEDYTNSIVTTGFNSSLNTGYQLTTPVFPNSTSSLSYDKNIGDIHTRSFVKNIEDNTYTFGPWIRQLNTRQDFIVIDGATVDIYVDCENGDDSLLNDGSKEHPLKTFSAVMSRYNKLIKNSLKDCSCNIWMRPGTYDIFETIFYGNGYGVHLSVYKWLNDGESKSLEVILNFVNSIPEAQSSWGVSCSFTKFLHVTFYDISFKGTNRYIDFCGVYGIGYYGFLNCKFYSCTIFVRHYCYVLFDGITTFVDINPIYPHIDIFTGSTYVTLQLWTHPDQTNLNQIVFNNCKARAFCSLVTFSNIIIHQNYTFQGSLNAQKYLLNTYSYYSSNGKGTNGVPGTTAGAIDSTSHFY